MTVLATVLAFAMPTPAQSPPILDKPPYDPQHQGCQTEHCDQRVTKRQRASRKRKEHAMKIAVVAPYRSRLERMAGCESGGRWYINTGNGFYGGLQFTLSSWWSVGGRGYPHVYPKLEQMYRAILLMRVQGWGAWPKCQYA
jgi:hypothetical protein